MGKRRCAGKHMHIPIAKHKREGTRLRPPLAELNPRLIDWVRDLLPEHLWIGALAEHFGIDTFHRPYNVLLDAIDSYLPPEFVGLGLISDFGLVPEDQRDRFLRQHFDLVEKLFYRPVGRLLAFYPESPAAWLVPRCLVERDGSLDPDTELGRLRNLVVRLLPGKDEFAGRVRAVPLNRLLKHGKIKLVAGLPVVELLPRYPHTLTDDERYHVESMARNVINMAIHQRPIPHSFRWAQYFWRHNFDLVPCRPIQQIPVTGESLSGEQAECLEQTLT